MGGTLTTFGCVEWESELFWGVLRAMGCSACQMLPLQASKEALSWHEPTGTILYIQVRTGTYSYILLCTSMYWNKLVFTSFFIFRC